MPPLTDGPISTPLGNGIHMGTLIVMRYPTTLFAKLADHTYVKCGTGAKAWGCWGGKTGGTELRRGTGSTKRADAIAGPKERAGITCYLINGVCHQAANRILLPAGINVRGARGASVSEAMFTLYGRLGFWPCSAPFDRKTGVSGDLPACLPPAGAPAREDPVSAAEERDWAYSTRVLALYKEAESIKLPRSQKDAAVPAARQRALNASASAFHGVLFKTMCEFRLGPRMDRALEKKLASIRAAIEKKQAAAATHRRMDGMSLADYAGEIDRLTLKLQSDLAGAMRSGDYEQLLGQTPGEQIVLADPSILETLS